MSEHKSRMNVKNAVKKKKMETHPLETGEGVSPVAINEKDIVNESEVTAS